jgi:hypothetical protein
MVVVLVVLVVVVVELVVVLASSSQSVPSPSRFHETHSTVHRSKSAPMPLKAPTVTNPKLAAHETSTR